jgi:hypothetical protein
MRELSRFQRFPAVLNLNRLGGKLKMKYFLWLIFVLFIGEIIYMIFFEELERLEKKKKYSVRKKSGRLKW